MRDPLLTLKDNLECKRLGRKAKLHRGHQTGWQRALYRKRMEQLRAEQKPSSGACTGTAR